MIRKRYNYLVENLRDDLLALGSAVEHALLHALNCLQTRNITVAHWVIDNDSQIDRDRTNLEERVIKLLATQQPIVARDLRLLSVVASIATELERIGDYASSIARRVCRSLQTETAPDLPPAIEQMTHEAVAMLRTSLDAFLHQDVELARSLAAADNRLDTLRDQIDTELKDRIRADVACLDAAIDLRDIVHALERSADRATNIGEQVIYLVTSDIEELNP